MSQIEEYHAVLREAVTALERITHNQLIFKYKNRSRRENNEASKKQAGLEHFVEKTPLNKNLSLVASSKPEIYAIRVKQTNLNH
ncbi:hypothetical protein N2K86_16810 [Enterobacter mori]|uniref:hypothetical protein n=1 Tax=Enterobacter mori TaxID=539813 RepID=UPI0021B0F12A|nr:hypothetical protein [Enterobacter mori]UWX92314.1 hypothetical protein N2K86_16810 [Enterobacter mori]